MRTMIQLNSDKTKAHWKWKWDDRRNDKGILVYPLKKMFTPEVAALQIDVTDVIPEPQEGWLYDGKNFTKPELPQHTIEELLTKLEKMKQVYLDSKYPPQTREWLHAHMTRAVIMPGTVPQSHINAIKQAWDFINGQIVVNFLSIGNKIKSGEITSLDAADFTILDDLDPHITVAGVMKLE